MAKFQIVSYTDGQGFVKPALVIGTRKSVQKGQTIVPRPEKGSKNLLVFSPKDGHTYVRTNIPRGADGEARTWAPTTPSEPETDLVGAASF